MCPAIPAATIGRMAKELTIRSGERLFIDDVPEFVTTGEKAAQRALEEMGGYPGLISKLPFDRGDTNQALVSLCLKVAAAVETTSPDLAASLRAQAVRLHDEERPAGWRIVTESLPSQLRYSSQNCAISQRME